MAMDGKSHTSHMRFYISAHVLKERESTDSEISTYFSSGALFEKNLQSLRLVTDLINTLIKSNTSLRKHLDNHIKLFIRNCPDSVTVKHLMGPMRFAYTSAASIAEWIDALYQCVALGIYIEICSDLQPNEEPMFGILLDCGSRFARWREYSGIPTYYCRTCIIYFSDPHTRSLECPDIIHAY